MRLLRKDLIVLQADKNGDTRMVRDPVSGDEFEFGEPEYFLIESLREPYSEAVLLARLRSRFGVERSREDFHEFLSMLDENGLLQDGPVAADSAVDRATNFSDSIRTSVGRAGNGIKERGAATPQTHEPDDLSERERASLTTDRRKRGVWHLFCPERLFDFLASSLYPARHLVKLIPILLAIGFLGLWFNPGWLTTDLWNIRAEFSLLGRLAFAGLTVNLTTQLFQGIVARHYGLDVPSFGIGLAFGLIPSLRVSIAPAPGLDKSARMWITSTSILVRLALFSLGTIVWLMTRASGTLLPDIAGMLAMLSGLGLFFVANPLMRGDGYRLLATYVGMPNLRQRANRALKSLFVKRPEAIERHANDTVALRAYALASILFVVLLVGLIGVLVARRLEASFQGAGVALFLLLIFYLLLHFRRQAGAKRATGTPPMGRSNTAQSARQAPDGVAVVAASRRVSPRSEKKPFGLARLLRYLLLATLVGCLFLPYHYETGGQAEILPMAKRQIFAETPGVIDLVFYEGGEWVEQGTVIAQMANHRQTKDLHTTESAIREQQANIARLETTPSKEEVDLAVQQLETASLTYKYSAARADRMKTLYERGSISFDAYDDAAEKKEVDRQLVSERQANLLATKNQVNPNEIDAAKAEEQRLQEELVYYEEQLRRTSLRMPINGRIITMSLKNLENKYLEEGLLFAEVEDAHEVRVTISIPESDIGEVSVGDEVRLKLWTYPDRIFVSTVKEIWPATSEAEYGTVVVVESILSNDEKLLRSGMTGHAKVQGSEMFVIQAFTRALVRFVLIEVWSWLP